MKLTHKIKKSKFKYVRRFLRVFAGFLLLLLLIVLFIRSPWGQNIIIDYATNYIAKKTDTKFQINKAFITFDGNVKIEKLYLEDQKGDTLIYSKSLEANLPLLGMIRGSAMGVDDLKWEGVMANIIRKDTIKGYNFQFLIDAFATQGQNKKVRDTSATTPEIIIGAIKLKNANIIYNDVPLGIESQYEVGELSTSMQKVDAERMVFQANDLLLKNSAITYVQKPVLLTSDEEVALPKLSATNLNVKNTQFFYKDDISNLGTQIQLTSFKAKQPILDLTKQTYTIKTIALNDSKITLNTVVDTNTSNIESNKKFALPELYVKVDDVNLQNNKFDYVVNNHTIQKGLLDANALSFQNINLNAKTICYKKDSATIQLNSFNFRESSGLSLDKLSLKGDFSDKSLSIKELQLASENNQLRGNIHFNYSSLSQFIQNPENTNLQLNLPSINFSLHPVLRLQPDLKSNIYVNQLGKKRIYGQVFAKGNLSNINIYNSKLNWGKTTKLTLNGNVANPTNVNELQFKLDNIKAETEKSDIQKFISTDSLGVQIPKEILLTGSANGNVKDISANLQLKSSLGIITVDGNFKNDDIISFNITADAKKLALGKLLQNNQLGEATVSIQTKGKGQSLNNLDATLKAIVGKLELKNYVIKNAKINGDLKNGVGNLTSTYKDKNVNLNLNSTINLDTVQTKASATLNVIGADLAGLGFTRREIKTGMDIKLNFEGNTKKYAVDANVNNGVVVYDNQTYLLGSIKAKSYVDKDTTAVSFKNKMVNLQLESNANPEQFTTALGKHIFSYFYRDEVLPDSIKKPVNIKFKGRIAQTPLLEEVFLVNVKDVDTVNINMNFNQNKRKLDAKITAPHINYNGNEVDSLAFAINTSQNDFNFKLSFKDIKANPLNVPKTIITGNQKNNELSLNFIGIHKEEVLMNVNTKITGNRDSLQLTVLSNNLILNKHQWQIPASNSIELINKNQLKFNDFKITKSNQSIEITEKLTKNSRTDNSVDHITILYQNFKIEEVFNYLNPEKEIATGVLGGEFILEDPFQNTGIIADLNIENLRFLKTNFGKLSVEGKSLGNGKYDFGAKLKEGDVDLDIIGDYIVANNKASLNLNLDINSFKMKALNTLSLGEVKEATGVFSGSSNVSGTLSEPKYNGDIKFTNAGFNITKLNTKFLLVDENLRINNEGVFMDNFIVLDAKKNKLTLKGNIKTESFINPEFNLALKAKNFRVLNASKEDNPDLYGTASFNANAELTGNLSVPKLAANVTIGKGTKVTYLLPATYAGLENRDEVVSFVNREDPDDILTQTEEQSTVIKGFDIFANLKVNKDAAITVVIDKNTGDNFKISGDGNVIFNMLPNGRISLTGAYTVASGHYELNLYGLVNRKFYLAPGGEISWSGNPFDAKLNASAIYNIKTSASPLMAAQISNEDPSVKNKFKQVLPFNVYLNIDGELLQPKISFNLEMPEDDQGAIGGQVYGRVQQINQQEEELNKQVFSLLVLNRFYPDSGSDGSLGGFSTIARDNLNDAVAGQLNAFSDKVLGNSGVELNFDLNSYTDYQGTTATDRTQLGVTAQKQLFNERLTVRVGSDVDIAGNNPTGEQTPLIGNVSLEYKLSEDGRYLLRGFRKSEFENVIDGQTIISGVALIFTQEFNQFRELWDAILRSKNDAYDKQQEKIENNLEEQQEKTNKSINKEKN